MIVHIQTSTIVETTISYHDHLNKAFSVSKLCLVRLKMSVYKHVDQYRFEYKKTSPVLFPSWAKVENFLDGKGRLLDFVNKIKHNQNFLGVFWQNNELIPIFFAKKGIQAWNAKYILFSQITLSIPNLNEVFPHDIEWLNKIIKRCFWNFCINKWLKKHLNTN